MPETRELNWDNRSMLYLPLAAILSVAAIGLLSQVRQHAILGPSFLGWTLFMLVFLGGWLIGSPEMAGN